MKALILLLASLPAAAQNLSGTSLTLTGPKNTQWVGGVGSAGDASCPQLSKLSAGQFAFCYFASGGTLELGYAGGSYSPFLRAGDVGSQPTSAIQITTLSQQVSALQSQVATLSNQVNALSTTASPSTVLDVVSTKGTLGSGQFLTLQMATVNTDTAGTFNRATSTYTIASSGYYLCVSKMRLDDTAAPGISYGEGTGLANADETGFLWFQTVANTRTSPNRQGSLNTSIVHYNQGDQVRMYAYLDYETLLPVDWAEMTIVKLGN